VAASSDDVGGRADRRRGIGLDLGPLRRSKDFRSIFIAGLVGTIGAQGT
jgi:hypothetical protein